MLPPRTSRTALLRAYLAVRGPAVTDHVFVYRDWALGFTEVGGAGTARPQP
jgi:hypothetical protein